MPCASLTLWVCRSGMQGGKAEASPRAHRASHFRLFVRRRPRRRRGRAGAWHWGVVTEGRGLSGAGLRRRLSPAEPSAPAEHPAPRRGACKHLEPLRDLQQIKVGGAYQPGTGSLGERGGGGVENPMLLLRCKGCSKLRGAPLDDRVPPTKNSPERGARPHAAPIRRQLGRGAPRVAARPGPEAPLGAPAAPAAPAAAAAPKPPPNLPLPGAGAAAALFPQPLAPPSRRGGLLSVRSLGVPRAPAAEDEMGGARGAGRG